MALIAMRSMNLAGTDTTFPRTCGNMCGLKLVKRSNALMTLSSRTEVMYFNDTVSSALLDTIRLLVQKGRSNLVAESIPWGHYLVLHDWKGPIEPYKWLLQQDDCQEYLQSDIFRRSLYFSMVTFNVDSGPWLLCDVLWNEINTLGINTMVDERSKTILYKTSESIGYHV